MRKKLKTKRCRLIRCICMGYLTRKHAVEKYSDVEWEGRSSSKLKAHDE